MELGQGEALDVPPYGLGQRMGRLQGGVLQHAVTQQPDAQLR
ncbi:hypothetical protein [Arsenicicoccus dermatophilus]|nr:hypothetical protein [Arsenicicoccus dermatophilus]